MALGYKVALLGVWWKRGEVDTRFFSSKVEQKTYFDNLISAWSSLMNFNINDNITTSITYRDTSGRAIDELLKCNYAVIKDKNNNYRYYFITSIMADSNNQIIATLDLDDIQNNLIGNLNNFPSVFVKNWTGNNYKSDGQGNIYFDFTNISLQNTGDAPQLFNKASNEIFIKYTGYNNIDIWLNDNIKAWRYVFVNQNQRLGAPTPSNRGALDAVISEASVKLENNNAITLPYGAISCPIYKPTSTHKIYIKYEYNSVDYYMLLDTLALDAFFNLQDNNFTNYPIGTYGIEEKISNILPYVKGNGALSQYTIDNDGDLIINCNIPTGGNTASRGHEFYYMAVLNDPDTGLTKEQANKCVASGYYQITPTLEATANFQAPFNFSQGYIEDQKLLDINYSKLRLRIANQFYDYNPLAYFTGNSTNINLLYTEVLKVGISKIYFRLDYKGEYKQPNNKDYTGLITSLDLTEPLLTNQWADYLASHKNYYLQTAFNNTIGLVNGALSAKNGADAFKVGLNTFAKIYNQQLDREDLQQSPNGLSNANGDPYFNLGVDSIKPKVEYLSVSENTKQALLAKFMSEGVPYNRFMLLSNTLDKHLAYTYLSCIINQTSVSLSTKEYERLKIVMSNGLRYWYTDDQNLYRTNYYKG